MCAPTKKNRKNFVDHASSHRTLVIDSHYLASWIYDEECYSASKPERSRSKWKEDLCGLKTVRFWVIALRSTNLMASNHILNDKCYSYFFSARLLLTYLCLLTNPRYAGFSFHPIQVENSDSYSSSRFIFSIIVHLTRLVEKKAAQ